MRRDSQARFAVFAAFILLVFLVMPFLPTPEIAVKSNSVHPMVIAAPTAVMALSAPSQRSGTLAIADDWATHRPAEVLQLTCTRLC